MYKLVIVDDEQIIREGIAANTDFASLGIELVGSCENGVEALDVIRSEQPDIVMTDINMPFMNGMELAEEVLRIYPLTKIIFLTGYDRFEYVKQALRLKITDYLVKPILPKELLKIFTKVLRTIEAERLEDEQVNRLKEKLAETEPVLRERFLNRLLKGPMATTELQGNMRSYGVPMELGIGCYQALCICVDQDPQNTMDYNQLDGALRRALALTLTYTEGMRDCIAFRTYFDRIAVLIGGEEDLDVIETGDLLAEKIHTGMAGKSDLSVCIGIGDTVAGLEQISRSYETAEEVLEYRMFSSANNISAYSDLKRKRGGSQISLSSYSASIYKEVKSGSLASLHRTIDQAFELLNQYAMPTDNYYIHVQNLLTSIMLSLEEQGIQYQDIFKGKLSPSLQLHEFGSLEEMQAWLKGICEDIIRYVTTDQEDYQTGQAKGAVAYINDHYGDPDISLKKVCKEMCMSVSYFSQIFKGATGTTFVDYLTGLRMEKAKELLRNTSDKTYEIASAVGYKDAHYFSLVFKKQVGMTATAFRDSMKL